MRTYRYDGDRVIAQETARAERQAEQLTRLRGRFLDGPVESSEVEPGALRADHHRPAVADPPDLRGVPAPRHPSAPPVPPHAA